MPRLFFPRSLRGCREAGQRQPVTFAGTSWQSPCMAQPVAPAGVSNRLRHSEPRLRMLAPRVYPPGLIFRRQMRGTSTKKPSATRTSSRPSVRVAVTTPSMPFNGPMMQRTCPPTRKSIATVSAAASPKKGAVGGSSGWITMTCSVATATHTPQPPCCWTAEEYSLQE